MKSRTKWYLAGTIVIVITAIILFRFVKTQTGAIGSFPGGGTDNFFWQTDSNTGSNK